MRLKLLSLICVVVLLTSVASFGAVTGQITGVTTDAASGEPMIGVTVALKGTAMGAISNEDGRYTILNVPVGDYIVAFSAVGYSTLEISQVHVSADLATVLSQGLTVQATDIGEIISVVAEEPLVIADKTATMEIIRRDAIQALPTRGFDQVIGIQSSVVRKNSSSFTKSLRGGREAVSSGSELNIRGGRPSEVAYYVDGFSQQDPLSGISTANIANNAIQEISVQSGGFSAEYGNVASAIVNVVTSSGTDQYHGNFDGVSDNLLTGDSYDQNWYSGDLSGPIPGLEKGTFFVAGERRWMADRTPSSLTKEIIELYGAPFGLDTTLKDGHRLPNNSLSGWSYQGKIDYAFSPNVKLLLSGNGSLDEWQEYRQVWLLNSAHTPRYEDKNLGLNAKLTHTLSANAFYNLSISSYATERYRGDGVLFKDYQAHERIFVNPEFDGSQMFWVPTANPFVEFDSLTGDSASGFTAFFESNVFTPDSLDLSFDTTFDGSGNVTAIDTTGRAIFLDRPSVYGGYLHRKSSYVGVKGNLTYQLNASHTTKFGFEFQKHSLRYFRNLDATKGGLPTLLNNYGFDSLGNESDNDDFKSNTKKPIFLGMYAQDRFDWRGLIVNAGIRFDYFDYKALRLRDPARPMDPDGTLLDSDNNNDDSASVIDRGDLEDSEKFTRISPRLGFSFPISDHTQMHINYGKFFQRPDLEKLYLNYNFLETRVNAGSFFPFASPNLEPEKTTQYEVGMTHQLGDNTAFSLTAYYKDVTGLTQVFHQSPASPTTYDFFANTDYGTIKGLDFNFKMRRTRNIALNLKYTLSWATGTGSYAESQRIIAWQNSEGTPKQTRPLDYDQRHALVGLFDYATGKAQGPKLGEAYPLENFRLNILVQAFSGTPYTPMTIFNEIFEGLRSSVPRGGINSARLPWTFTIDLKAEKAFVFGAYKLAPYIWVRNLLDRDNVIGVYEGTGKPTSTGWLETEQGIAFVANSGQIGEDRYQLKQNNPTNFTNPRQVLVGLRLGF